MKKRKVLLKKIIKIFSLIIPIKSLRKHFRNSIYHELDNNKIYYIDKNKNTKQVSRINNLKIEIEGCNNNVYIGYPSNFKNSYLRILGNENTFRIGIPNAKVECYFYMDGNTNNREISIGNDFSIQSGKIICKGENKKIIIGDNCMFSNNITIRSSDSHKIKNITTKEIINPDETVTIGDNVWMAQDVHCLKGSKIPSGSIIGAGSLVNKKFDEENCILAGVPAKIVKRNVEWDK